MLAPLRRSLILTACLMILVSDGLSVERQKRQLLNALNISTRPPRIDQPPKVPRSLGSRHNNDMFGGNMEKITLEPNTKSWTCLTPETIVADCFHWSLADIPSEVLSASLVVHSKSIDNVTVMVYEVDELFGELHFLDRFEMAGVSAGVTQIQIDISSQFQNWVRRHQKVKLLKIEFLSSSNYSSLRLHDSMLTAPHFELTIFRPNNYLDDKLECVGCCVIPFYVNFTEIGWNDWVLSPPGFWANFCSDGCSVDSDETYKFIKSSVQDTSMLQPPTCAPNYYGSVDFIVALGPRDIRKTRVHGMRALSCSCT